MLLPGSTADSLHKDAILSASSKANVKVSEIIRFDSVSKIPANPDIQTVVRSNMERLLTSRRESSIAYVKLEPLPKTVPGDVEVVQYGNKYTVVSGSHMTQSLVPNVTVGERVKRGDVLVYNEGYFTPEYGTKQVAWKHGLMANIILRQQGATNEDADVITRNFANRLGFQPAHVRIITVKSSTVLHDIVTLNQEVQTTDLLCVLEDGDLDELTISDDPDAVQYFAELDRKAPTAKYYGTIAEIDVKYSCPPESMHPSMQKLVKQIEKRKFDVIAKASGTRSVQDFPEPSMVPVGTKYRGVDFEADTVAILITIRTDLGFGQGDKLVIGNQLKTVCSGVVDHEITTESGLPIDMRFGVYSIFNRMVPSAVVNGLANRNLEEMRSRVLGAWFDGKKLE